MTVDLDWACEAAIEETLSFLDSLGVKPTIFTTHNSPLIASMLDSIDVGLHPYFSENSSHGATIEEVVQYVINLPHNIPAFRCHRFCNSNQSNQAMAEAGMLLSSNVCTDLEVISPFYNRFGLLEIPIFLEDGGYLWRQHPLTLSPELKTKIQKQPHHKVILIHPMHFAINTPHFKYMYDIKQSVSRSKWNNLTARHLKQLRHQGRGIRDLVLDVIKLGTKFSSFSELIPPKKRGVVSMQRRLNGKIESV